MAGQKQDRKNGRPKGRRQGVGLKARGQEEWQAKSKTRRMTGQKQKHRKNVRPKTRRQEEFHA